MPKLSETIDRLVSSFANDVIAALKDVPINELMLLTGDEDVQLRRTQAVLQSTSKRIDRTRRSVRSPKTPPLGHSGEALTAAGERFFADRGRKGATPIQLHEHLRTQGFEPGARELENLLAALTERGSICDAGFRRTTGRGTAPVYMTVTR